MNKIVCVTGCLGFMGYYVAKECLDLGWYVVGVDKMTYAANPDLLPKLERYPNFKFVKKDINDLDNLYECDYIINTAAETHVDNSIVRSGVFLHSNINGVYNLLQLVKEKSKYKMPTLLHFSTDEVYGDIVEGAHTETDILKPSNPYSATKAAADMLVLAWARTYEVPYVIVRPTNNYGIGQYVEKIIPRTAKYLTLGKKLPLHESGTPVRTWLHVTDTARAITTIVNSGKVNEIYNISGNYEDTNINVFKKVVKAYFGTDEHYLNYADFNYKRQGQDVRYSIDDSKLKALGWNPVMNFDESLSQIVDYYKNNFVW